MPSWEEIANEVVPPDANITGLATGAQRPIARSQWQRRFERPEGELKIIPCPACPAGASLEVALGGSEKSCARRGTHLEISRAAAEYDAPYADLAARLTSVLENPRFLALSSTMPRDLVLMDIETTGVSATNPLFLIGIPLEYEKFVERRRSGLEAASLLAPIIHHNALDLLTLAELLCMAHEA
jgi:uncharacterized protein YprB with RNaseH-like and TPR domain